MGDVAPSYLSHPQPDYPGEAKENGRQGMVMLDVLVSAEGRPVKVALARSSGTPELDQAALAAVRQWTFRPGRRAGVPAAAHALVPVRFELEP
jgi:protein TonB